ncbi:hypothetical protein ACFL9T_11740 [Thermodesulfobacteriota bacterium]
MKLQAVGEPLKRRSSTETGEKPNPHYSVEFSSEGRKTVHQFRVRDTSAYKCVIVREDSSILSQMKVGDILTLKFNFNNSPHLSEYLKTAIRFINKQDEGRFKGHYLVAFEILGR